MSPKVPQLAPKYVLPKASALSSKTGILYLFATLVTSLILYGIPYRWTAIIALGFLLSLILLTIASSNRSGQMFQVFSSLSIKIGLAPKYVIGFAEAEKVKL